MRWIVIIGLYSCANRQVAPQAASEAEPAFNPIVATATVAEATAIACETDQRCTVSTPKGLRVFNAATGELTTVDDAPEDAQPPWPVASNNTSLEEQWNAQVQNQWRSPFQANVPAPNGGRLRLQRGLTPGTSRVVRLGGSVLTARQAPDPGAVAYPNTLALHPTGAEVYLLVWPNPFLIAFNARTMETTWRISLGDPALGLFVSEDGRYLIAETGGVAPEHQLLDYETPRHIPPEGTDPHADARYQWLDRPSGTATVLVDLGSGQVAARLPGKFAGFARHSKGAFIASESGVTHVRHMPTNPEQ